MNQKSVQIKDKKITIDILSGEEKLGVIKFNPDDTMVYMKFISLIEQLTTGSKGLKEIKIDESELNKKLKTLEDFENASSIFAKIKQSGLLTVEMWGSVCTGLDEIFGEGVCQCFTQGDLDPELLSPLIDCVAPYFKKSRKSKTDKYKAKPNDVM